MIRRTHVVLVASPTGHNKEIDMFSREFRELPVGRLFHYNGNDYFKQSTRTARLLINGRAFYFRQREVIHSIAY